MTTLAGQLGTTTHLSHLLQKARRLGLAGPWELQALAVHRGCLHYRSGEHGGQLMPPREHFSDEELAVALLCVALPYDPQSIRCGAAMLGSTGINAKTVARLAEMERSVVVVRHVAEAGAKFEPANEFWFALLDALPPSAEPKSGVLPHPSRFVAMNGIVRGKPPGQYSQWVRPVAA